MPGTSVQFQRLAKEFASLVESLNACRSFEERRSTLRRIKFHIDQMDALIYSMLARNKNSDSGSTIPGSPIIEP